MPRQIKSADAAATHEYPAMVLLVVGTVPLLTPSALRHLR